MTTETRDLLPRVASGDEQAVSECLERYGGLIWTIARRHAADDADAEDAVQEVFLALWKSADRFDATRASETTFVTMIARRRLIDRHRRVSRTRTREHVTDDVPETASPNDDPALSDPMETERALRALKELRPDQQKVLRMSVLEGLTHREISSATGLPLGTVKSHAFRGLARIRKLLGVESGQESRS